MLQRFRLWRAPLIPVALAYTLGILLDVAFDLPLTGSLFAAGVCLFGWGAANLGPSRGLSQFYLLLSLAALGAAYHHFRYQVWPTTDIGFFAKERPIPIQARGILREKPRLSTSAPTPSMVTVLELRQFKAQWQWKPISGKAYLIISNQKKSTLKLGDEVEVIGNLFAIRKPSNPGEVDFARILLRRGIHASIVVKDPRQGVTRLSTPLGTPQAWLNGLRRYGLESLGSSIPKSESGIASAILLGDRQSLSREETERYRKSGVVHVLVISGQHFLILAVFLQSLLCLFGIPRRHLWIALLLIGYAILVGLRPPVVRACVTFVALAGGAILKRKASLANSLALAWLVVTFFFFL